MKNEQENEVKKHTKKFLNGQIGAEVMFAICRVKIRPTFNEFFDLIAFTFSFKKL